MEPMEGSGTAASRLQKRLTELFEKFKKTPYALAVAVAVSALLFFVITVYAGTNCLAPLLPPLVLLGMLWYFGTKGAKNLLIVGFIACLVFAGVWVYAVAGLYQDVSQGAAASQDGKTLTNGTLSPTKGNSGTSFYFNVTVRSSPNNSLQGDSVKVIIVPVAFPGKPELNHTLALVPGTERTELIGGVNYTFGTYSYATTVSNPINQYYFLANLNNTWVLAADYSSGVAVRLVGPVFSDFGAVASALILFALVQVYASTFPIYAILVLMIWWTRRARRMREDQIKKWQEEREQEEAKPSKGKAKTPSLQKAMGLEQETFVCSECGADVPADATVCPKCGEKFD